MALGRRWSDSRPVAVCRRWPKQRRRHRHAYCQPNRAPIRHGMLNLIAETFVARMVKGPTPWLELRRLVDDQIPATGGQRQRGVRGDLIESIVLVVLCLLSRMDIASLRVGFRPSRRRRHDFVGLTRERLARWCDLSEETVSRVLTLLRRAGLVHGPGRDGVNVIAQPCDRQPDGSFDRHPAIRRFDELFFIGLGFGAWLGRRTAPEGAARPSPADRPAVSPKSSAALVEALASKLALERPPD